MLFFLQLFHFFAVVLISFMIPTYNFAVVPFILQLYNFFCSCTIFFAVVHFFCSCMYNLLPDHMRFWTILNVQFYVDLVPKKGSLLGDSPQQGYLRQPSPRNYFVRYVGRCRRIITPCKQVPPPDFFSIFHNPHRRSPIQFKKICSATRSKLSAQGRGIQRSHYTTLWDSAQAIC